MAKYLVAFLFGAVLGLVVNALGGSLYTREGKSRFRLGFLFDTPYRGNVILPLGAAILGLLAALYLPPGRRALNDPSDILAILGYACILYFLSNLWAIVVCGIKYDTVPTGCTIPSIILGPVAAFLIPGFSGTFNIPGLPSPINGLIFNLSGLVLGYGFMWLVRWLYLKFRKVEGLGLGNLALAGMIGAFLGPRRLIATLIIWSLLSLVGAIVWIRIKAVWSAGPKQIQASAWLAATAIATTFIGDFLVTVYLRSFRS